MFLPPSPCVCGVQEVEELRTQLAEAGRLAAQAQAGANKVGEMWCWGKQGADRLGRARCWGKHGARRWSSCARSGLALERLGQSRCASNWLGHEAEQV